jgi:DNA-binding NarL/FixJ family response regulator
MASRLGQPQVVQPQVAQKLPSLASPKRVLIADDSGIIREVVRSLIENKVGVEVCGEAIDGIDAVEKAKQLKPDLVLVDFRMPRLNGIEVSSIVKKMLPKVRIVLCTMYDHQVSKKIATAAHIDLVVSKTDGIGKLLETIDVLLDPQLS